MAKFWDITGGLRKRALNEDSAYREYLLGGLSARRRVAIEQNAIVEDSVFDSLRAAEEALVQGYAEGALPLDVRKRFESLLETSVAWQRKVRLAKALLLMAAQAKKAVVDAPELATTADAVTERAVSVGAKAEFGGLETLFKTGSNKSARVLSEDKAAHEQVIAIARISVFGKPSRARYGCVAQRGSAPTCVRPSASRHSGRAELSNRDGKNDAEGPCG